MISQNDYSYVQTRVYVQAVWFVVGWVGVGWVSDDTPVNSKLFNNNDFRQDITSLRKRL